MKINHNYSYVLYKRQLYHTLVYSSTAHSACLGRANDYQKVLTNQFGEDAHGAASQTSIMFANNVVFSKITAFMLANNVFFLSRHNKTLGSEQEFHTKDVNICRAALKLHFYLPMMFFFSNTTSHLDLKRNFTQRRVF